MIEVGLGTIQLVEQIVALLVVFGFGSGVRRSDEYLQVHHCVVEIAVEMNSIPMALALVEPDQLERDKIDRMYLNVIVAVAIRHIRCFAGLLVTIQLDLHY